MKRPMKTGCRVGLWPSLSFEWALAASLLLTAAGIAAEQKPAFGKLQETGRRKIVFEDSYAVYCKPALEVFGEKMLVSVETGFFFVDGKYVPPPYLPSRKANLLYINSQRIAKYAWPPHWLCISIDKPRIPADILKKARNWNDLKMDSKEIKKFGIDTEIYRPYSYLDVITTFARFHYLPRTAWNKLAHEVETYPFVKKVDILAPPKLGFTTYYTDGATMEFGPMDPCYAPIFHIPGHRTIVKKMDAQLDSLRQELAAGSMVFWDGSRRFFGRTEDVLYIGQTTERIPASVLRDKLPKVIGILQEDAPLKKRAWALVVLRFVRSRESARAFINAFTTDAEFRKRLESLEKPK